MFHVDIEQQERLTAEQTQVLGEMWKRCAGRILLSTTLAKSGHPGGSLSSLHLLLVLYSVMRHRPSDPHWQERDRLVVSMGHISPGVYSVLSEFGYFPEDDFLNEFRRAGSPFAGHVETAVPGVEWNTGNLGQGLSVGTGMAFAARARKLPSRTMVMMGDGEQQKGQVAEARRFASKFGLGNLIAIVDRNHLQIGGDTENVMSVRVRQEYEAAGWNVLYVPNGHDFNEIYMALRRAWLHDGLYEERPTVLVARTVMGKGVSFMEDRAKYHGSPLPEDQCAQALTELGLPGDTLERWNKSRASHENFRTPLDPRVAYPEINQGTPILYDADTVTDCRSAYGAALKDLAEHNNQGGAVRIVGFSCDLEGSVKMNGFHQISPDLFVETGIQEHHAAASAGAVSREGIATFFSTFGVFAADETYNQHRLNDLNHTHLKVVATHVGLDVGEDGPTHQCVDYLGLMNNLLGYSIFIPADPNQTDRIIRHVAATPGNVFVGMGRSKMSVITDEDGNPFFGTDYVFTPGKADWLRRGTDLTFITYGAVVPQVMKAQAMLREQGFTAGVLNMASIKPLDEGAILQAAEIGPIITVEDHLTHTGLGAMAAGVLARGAVAQKLVTLGVTFYGSSGKPLDLYRKQGLDADSLVEKAKTVLS